MDEYRLPARYTIKDGVMYIPAWEWNSSEQQILGLPLFYSRAIATPISDPHADWLVLMFPNGWSLICRFRSDLLVIDIHAWRWIEKQSNGSHRERVFVDSLDRLLGCIRTVAERPAREEVENG